MDAFLGCNFPYRWEERIRLVLYPPWDNYPDMVNDREIIRR